MRTEAAYDRQVVPVEAGTPSQPLAVFTIVQHFSRWEGSLDCAFQHEYDGASWVTLRITNVSPSIVSFDYTIVFHQTVSSSVQNLAAGMSSERVFCVVSCGSPPYDPLVIEVSNLRHGP